MADERASYMQPGAKFPGALQVIREQLPRFFEEPHTEAMRNVASILPQEPAEFALEAALFPVGGPARKALMAAAGAMYGTESDAAGARAAIGGLRALIENLVGSSPRRLDADAEALLRRGAAEAKDYTPIETWDAFLNERNMVPKGVNLSDYIDEANLYYAKVDPFMALRSQRGSGLDIGNTQTPGWMGTHFDLTGGPQALDVLSSAKRTPTQLTEPSLVEARVDPRARVLPVTDEIINDPGHEFWAKLFNEQRIFNDERQLVPRLKEQGIQGLLYNNVFEGIQNSRVPPGALRAASPRTLEDILRNFGNPSISVLDPNIVDVRSIARKRGGLASAGVR